MWRVRQCERSRSSFRRLGSPVHSVSGSSVGGEAAAVGRPVLLLLLHFHSSAPTTNMETVLRRSHVSPQTKTCQSPQSKRLRLRMNVEVLREASFA